MRGEGIYRDGKVTQAWNGAGWWARKGYMGPVIRKCISAGKDLRDLRVDTIPHIFISYVANVC